VKLDAVVERRIGEGCHHGQRAALPGAVLAFQPDEPRFQRGATPGVCP
jgi:hypothetical protein